MPCTSLHSLSIVYPSSKLITYHCRTYYYSIPPFNTIAAIFRASTGLAFTELAAWSTRYLQEMWPSSLAALSTTPIPFATETVILGRQCSISSVLKRALYELIRTEGFGQYDNERAPDARLSPSDHEALQRSREKLTLLWITTAGSVLNDFRKCPASSLPTSAVTTAGVCLTSDWGLTTIAHTRLVHESGIFAEYHCDPLNGMKALMEAPWAEAGFCGACVDLRKQVWGQAMEKSWQDLDAWFGISADVA